MGPANGYELGFDSYRLNTAPRGHTEWESHLVELWWHEEIAARKKNNKIHVYWRGLIWQMGHMPVSKNARSFDVQGSPAFTELSQPYLFNSEFLTVVLLHQSSTFLTVRISIRITGMQRDPQKRKVKKFQALKNWVFYRRAVKEIWRNFWSKKLKFLKLFCNKKPRPGSGSCLRILII